MKRMMDDSLITELLKSNLWTNKLHEDCKNQLVFLAIRDNKIGFYHQGGLLFSFENSVYKTHIKYAAVIKLIDKNYLTETELQII